MFDIPAGDDKKCDIFTRAFLGLSYVKAGTRVPQLKLPLDRQPNVAVLWVTM